MSVFGRAPTGAACFLFAAEPPFLRFVDAGFLVPSAFAGGVIDAAIAADIALDDAAGWVWFWIGTLGLGFMVAECRGCEPNTQ